MPPLAFDFEKLECLKKIMSGISLCAIKQMYTLIYFDGGEDFLGATNKSPGNMVDVCFRGCLQ